MTRFAELCEGAFTKRAGAKIPLIGILVENIHHSRYRTATLEQSLKAAFSEDLLLFGGNQSFKSSAPSVQVAVTATSITDNIASVLSNHNRPGETGSPRKNAESVESRVITC